MNKHALLVLPLFLLAAASAREDPAQDPQQETARRLAALEQQIVPVGGVILWWGTASDLPPGFEVCDGTVPFHRNATLKERKPDLRDRFVKGAKDISGFRPRNALEGGSNETPARRTEAHVLTADEIPAHTHPIAHTHTLQPHTHTLQPHVHSLAGHIHALGVWIQTALGSGGSQEVLVQGGNNSASTQPAQGNTGSGGAGSTDPGGGGQTGPASTPMSGTNSTRNLGHVHEIAASDNRPAFLEMLYIIRVL